MHTLFYCPSRGAGLWLELLLNDTHFIKLGDQVQGSEVEFIASLKPRLSLAGARL